ncbi:MAG: hypothetical protein ACTS73_07955 [Arsenophonus sp. NEOnobi-MAG3]
MRFLKSLMQRECASRFLKPIFDKESILLLDGANGWYKSFASEHEISQYLLIRLDNQRVIGKGFYIQNVNSYISLLKG